ncbi:MAG TPA: UDP-glucose/GDP-mannose dehydrogenase family protein [Nitriliruptorales bacterium]
MKIAVVGVGHVGLVTVACLAEWGHEVVGMDDDADRIAALTQGRMPFHEPDLDALVQAGVNAGHIRFTTDLAEAVDGSEAVFVCVGTPSLPGGGLNLTFVEAVGRNVATAATSDLVLIEKSTVPANTGVRMRAVIDRELARLGKDITIDVASNPEFLREGTAVADTLHPDRIVYGTETVRSRDVLREIYAPLVDADDCPAVETDVATAELIKHASNAFLATKISFINAVAQVCERVGADVTVVADGMGHDRRIGRAFLHAGIGYGGSCFPKDVDGFVHLARELGVDFTLLEEVRRINEMQRDVIVEKLRAELWNLEQKTVALLGAAFKPGTDDLREAPALAIARQLLDAGATVRIWDPVALPGVKEQLPDAVTCDDPIEACREAHAAVVTTEWPEVIALSMAAVADALAYPIVIDGRNALDPEAARAAGLHYHGVGRPSPR